MPALLYQIGTGKRDLLSSQSPALSSSHDDWVMYLALGAALQSSFHTAAKHASAASSAGFSSGGGTGPGGGGGGSGAF